MQAYIYSTEAINQSNSKQPFGQLNDAIRTLGVSNHFSVASLHKDPPRGQVCLM